MIKLLKRREYINYLYACQVDKKWGRRDLNPDPAVSSYRLFHHSFLQLSAPIFWSR